jgi:hypothetical protein
MKMKLSSALDVNLLSEICEAKEEDFAKTSVGKVIDTPDGKLIYYDRKSPILGIAHLDTAIGTSPVSEINHRGLHLGVTPSLDDRLGAYILMGLLPKMGVVCDILLTVGEESGRSTAQHFTREMAAREYNWMFQFDRHGTDTVMYEYETLELKQKLTNYGFRVGKGSFSDICYLEHMGVKAFNFGCAYYHEHSWDCFVDFEQMLGQVGLFINFFNHEALNKFPHVPVVHEYKYESSSKYFDENWWKESGYWSNTTDAKGNKVAKFVTWGQLPMPKSRDIYDDLDEELLQLGAHFDNELQVWLIPCPVCAREVEEDEYSFSQDMCYSCKNRTRKGL